MVTNMNCPICKAPATIAIGPLTVEGPGMKLYELDGEQCTLCGHLGIQIPQPWLVKLYPPEVELLTLARRDRHRRQQSRLGHK